MSNSPVIFPLLSAGICIFSSFWLLHCGHRNTHKHKNRKKVERCRDPVIGQPKQSITLAANASCCSITDVKYAIPWSFQRDGNTISSIFFCLWEELLPESVAQQRKTQQTLTRTPLPVVALADWPWEKVVDASAPDLCPACPGGHWGRCQAQSIPQFLVLRDCIHL